ncbi:thioredoxin family protein [Aureispira anguillae]|uniref:Thioredoxin family protein n=1 Tax=Aureispira anguillae TaxID=2864201 RepID=A0A915YBT2_9BACT|nr:thioredoxin family protein [Aureispira anguillae]BDS10190.1 thioredoxin family protein [Aureispira anguillae]
MTLQEFKDVVQLNKLANSWVEDYQENNIGVYSSQQKKQLKEMKQLQAKTQQLIEKQSGDLGETGKDWKESYEIIQELAKSSPAFLSCFGNTQALYDSSAPISKETALLAIQLKKMTASWYGRFADEVQDNTAISLMASLHEQSKKVLAAPKTTDGDSISIVFYGSNNKRCRKMRKNIEFIGDRYEGLIQIEQHMVEDGDAERHKLGLDNLPTIFFKRGKETIAKHEGLLSISATEQKVGILLEGANFSDSTSFKSIKDMKSVNPKELYSLGEYLLFYFEASWCGICKKTTPVVLEQANTYNKVYFEKIEVDGSHNKHKSFGVTEVPSLVFVHDGKVIGKHIGYINPSSLKQLLEQFAVSNKRKIGISNSGESSVIDQEMQNKKDSDKKRKVKDKK